MIKRNYSATFQARKYKQKIILSSARPYVTVPTTNARFCDKRVKEQTQYGRHASIVYVP